MFLHKKNVCNIQVNKRYKEKQIFKSKTDT